MSTVHTKGIQAGCGEKETQTSKGETQCSVCYTDLDNSFYSKLKFGI